MKNKFGVSEPIIGTEITVEIPKVGKYKCYARTIIPRRKRSYTRVFCKREKNKNKINGIRYSCKPSREFPITGPSLDVIEMAFGPQKKEEFYFQVSRPCRFKWYTDIPSYFSIRKAICDKLPRLDSDSIKDLLSKMKPEEHPTTLGALAADIYYFMRGQDVLAVRLPKEEWIQFKRRVRECKKKPPVL